MLQNNLMHTHTLIHLYKHTCITTTAAAADNNNNNVRGAAPINYDDTVTIEIFSMNNFGYCTCADVLQKRLLRQRVTARSDVRPTVSSARSLIGRRAQSPASQVC